MTQFSLCWDIQKNICQGLSSLQQNGEFVDMTLAADGHLVKVHQMIIALASPYLKELISSANCKYPIIFLNKVSYTSLCSILEYVYTGEVLVAADLLQDFLQAGRELHIMGIVDMSIQQCMPSNSLGEEDDEVLFEIGSTTDAPEDSKYSYILREQENTEEMADEARPEGDHDSIDAEAASDITKKIHPKKQLSHAPDQIIQYTVSNQGSLQMILNRFIYFVKHMNKYATQWRCVDYVSKQARCPAYVITENNVVVKRVGVHTHMFHDKRIIKKLRVGSVYSAIQEAQRDGNLRRERKAVDASDAVDGSREAGDGSREAGDDTDAGDGEADPPAAENNTGKVVVGPKAPGMTSRARLSKFSK